MSHNNKHTSDQGQCGHFDWGHFLTFGEISSVMMMKPSLRKSLNLIKTNELLYKLKKRQRKCNNIICY